jgi:hypothetical protein
MAQAEPAEPPYDSWIAPDGGLAAEFFRRGSGFLVRCPDQADFEIDGDSLAVSCRPVPDLPLGVANTLFHNSISPLLANYRGGLNLHASGVNILGKAIGFVGNSRSGKTTLAGAFARAGHPLITEDVFVLERHEDGFAAAPTHPVLRLFPDSASFLLGEKDWASDNDGKVEIEVADTFPIAAGRSPLAAMFLLGSDEQLAVTALRLEPTEALAELIRHAFILDVEDKQVLRSHFLRLGDLAEAVPCFRLDYPRSYDRLPQVIDTVLRAIAGNGATHAIN